MIRVRTVCFGVVAPLLAAVAFAKAQRVTAPVVLENVTPSLPLGLYRHVGGEAKPGVIVAVREPAVARPYLRTLGFPADAPLLKRVVAMSGAIACAQGDRVIVGGAVLARAARDRQGVPLPRWRGCSKLRPGEVFLIGDDARSFDSRYFGPVATASVVGVYEPLR